MQYIKLSSALRELLEGLVIIGICSAAVTLLLAVVFAFIYGMNFVRYL